MERQGFTTWPVPADPVIADRDFPYVIDDVAWASEHGYGSDLHARIARLREDSRNQRYLDELSPRRREAALTALNGTPTSPITVTLPNGMTLSRNDNGCDADAQARLYGDLATWSRATAVSDNLTDLRRTRVRDADAFKEAVRAWARCMRRHGHDYATPWQSRAEFLAPDAEHSREVEIGVAVTEARCAASSGLTETIHQLDRKQAARLREEYGSAVTTKLRLQRAALPRARSIVAAG
ncbi:hypothetical protein [Salinactinospora qingdaonensis]